ncbi:uncharacterized protein AMSG_11265 [Thecamonas trahens ATCC 50062]|uniref:Integral membrane protein n=1 Tax=Thecamonas trahens ATCC 50062 TaxID=461836 RepID=A0A0L0DU79_THETB|nr:integral membrane protein [Thecamonas trahens ATCC 50062]KNC55825.1 integral membrane protein [Thecamonas trahens ATCC 50062]|eukprot:XP_013752802.1 integral membrane protein [Thecamonas trahens ATCC 50062]
MLLSPLFTPLASLAGGLAIGASSSLLLATQGKILGVSGIAYMSASPDTHVSNRTWRLAFLSGMVAAGSGLAVLAPAVFGPALVPGALPVAPLAASGVLTANAAYAAAGFLVGLGTKIGSGCTSGHGVCGLPRWSARSLVAVLSFMSSAAATLAITAGLGWTSPVAVPAAGSAVASTSPLAPAVAAVLAAAALAWPADATPLANKLMAGAWGMLFASGLGLAGMLNPLKVLGFLSPSAVAGGWDPSLALVMGGAVAFNLVAFPILTARGSTVTSPALPLDLPTSSDLNPRLIGGSVLFGLGWAIAGFCPGPAIASLATAHLSPHLLTWLAAFAAGQTTYHLAFR